MALAIDPFLGPSYWSRVRQAWGDPTRAVLLEVAVSHDGGMYLGEVSSNFFKHIANMYPKYSKHVPNI